MEIHFPNPFKHTHPPIRNAHQIFQSQLSFGERLADKVAAVAGSWWFISIQTIILSFWVALNITAFIHHWDPYPFILMNLVLSLQAAYTAPIIMISQKRQEARDRFLADNDYQVNRKTEEEVRAILDHLQAQNVALMEILTRLEDKNDATSQPKA